MFQVIVGMEDLGEFHTFTEALKFFFSKIRDGVKQNPSWQWLETTNFLVYTGEGLLLPVCFYDARDFGHRIGLLTGNGEFQEGAKEPTIEMVVEAFSAATTNDTISQLQELLRAVRVAATKLG